MAIEFIIRASKWVVGDKWLKFGQWLTPIWAHVDDITTLTTTVPKKQAQEVPKHLHCQRSSHGSKISYWQNTRPNCQWNTWANDMMQIWGTLSSLNKKNKYQHTHSLHQQDLDARETQAVVLPVWDTTKTNVAFNCVWNPHQQRTSWKEWFGLPRCLRQLGWHLADGRISAKFCHQSYLRPPSHTPERTFQIESISKHSISTTKKWPLVWGAMIVM